MSTKKDGRPNFDHLGEDNIAEVLEGFGKLVYWWLRKKGVPAGYLAERYHDFWCFVWRMRGNYDPKKGRMLTWLSWKFKHWYGDAARVNAMDKKRKPMIPRM